MSTRCSGLRASALTSRICLAFAIMCLLAVPSLANTGLLDSLLQNAGKHDFISYFGFSENNATSPIPGLTDHSYYSQPWTSSLLLSVDKSGRVVHIKIGVPRPLIDDEKVCTRGRDIVKSFVLASAVGEDLLKLEALADEMYVRGLDLQPIKMDPKSPAPAGMQAFKIGKGPVTNGDNAIFLSEIPKLPPRSSELFEVMNGKKDTATQVFRNCRITFSNGDMKASKSAIKILWCETWDEPFYKACLQLTSPVGKTAAPTPKMGAKKD